MENDKSLTYKEECNSRGEYAGAAIKKRKKESDTIISCTILDKLTYAFLTTLKSQWHIKEACSSLMFRFFTIPLCYFVLLLLFCLFSYLGLTGSLNLAGNFEEEKERMHVQALETSTQKEQVNSAHIASGKDRRSRPILRVQGRVLLL